MTLKTIGTTMSAAQNVLQELFSINLTENATLCLSAGPMITITIPKTPAVAVLQTVPVVTSTQLVRLSATLASNGPGLMQVWQLATPSRFVV